MVHVLETGLEILNNDNPEVVRQTAITHRTWTLSDKYPQGSLATMAKKANVVASVVAIPRSNPLSCT